MFQRNFEPQRGNYPFDFGNELGHASSLSIYPPSSVYLDNRSHEVFWQPTGWQQSHYTRDRQLSAYDQSLESARPIFGSRTDSTLFLYDWPTSHFRPTSHSHTPRQPARNQASTRLSPSSCLGPSSSAVSSFDSNHVVTSTPLSTVPFNSTIAPTPRNEQSPETLLHYPSKSTPLSCLFRHRAASGVEARQAQFHSPHRHVYLESPLNAGDLVISGWPLERSEPSLALVETHIRPGIRTRSSGVQASFPTPEAESLQKQNGIRSNMDVLDVRLSSSSDCAITVLTESPFHYDSARPRGHDRGSKTRDLSVQPPSP